MQTAQDAERLGPCERGWLGAKFYSRSKGATINVFDEAGKIIEERSDEGSFKEAC